jgi:hypothetical protein
LAFLPKQILEIRLIGETYQQRRKQLIMPYLQLQTQLPQQLTTQTLHKSFSDR